MSVERALIDELTRQNGGEANVQLAEGAIVEITTTSFIDVTALAKAALDAMPSAHEHTVIQIILNPDRSMKSVRVD